MSRVVIKSGVQPQKDVSIVVHCDGPLRHAGQLPPCLNQISNANLKAPSGERCHGRGAFSAVQRVNWSNIQLSSANIARHTLWPYDAQPSR